jgi:hypothetical protein
MMIARTEAAGNTRCGRGIGLGARRLGDAHHCSDSPAGRRGGGGGRVGRSERVEECGVGELAQLRLPGDSGGMGTETSTAGDRRVGPAAFRLDLRMAAGILLLHAHGTGWSHGFTNPTPDGTRVPPNTTAQPSNIRASWPDSAH